MEGEEKDRKRQRAREGGRVHERSQAQWLPLKVTRALTPYLKNKQLKGKNF